MPTNYNIPSTGTINYDGYLGIADPDAKYGVFPSVLLQGGFQEMPTITDMHEIPSFVSGGNGGTTESPDWGTAHITDDGWGTGRRRVGMLISVLDGGSGTPKLFRLIPNGYFGNGGNLGVTEWNALTDPQKYELLDPIGLYNVSGSPFGGFTVNVPTGAASDCWVELSFGGNDITLMSFDSNTSTLTTTLTHAIGDPNNTGSPATFDVVLPSGMELYDPVVGDATVMPTDVGGINSGTTAGDLDGLSFHQMFDKLLFPTVNPIGTGAGTLLNDNQSSYVEIDKVITVTLSSTANQGTLSNPAGVWTGDVASAAITGATSETPAVTAPNTIANVNVSNYTVAQGQNTWSLTTSFLQGPMPVDSTGADYPGARFNAGTRTNTTAFEGVWPIYIGTVAGEAEFSKRALIGQGSGNISISQAYGEVNGSLNHRIAVPVAMVQGGDITIELDGGQLGWQPSYPGDWTKSNTTFVVHGASGNVAYYLYTKISTGGNNNYRINW